MAKSRLRAISCKTVSRWIFTCRMLRVTCPTHQYSDPYGSSLWNTVWILANWLLVGYFVRAATTHHQNGNTDAPIASLWALIGALCIAGAALLSKRVK